MGSDRHEYVHSAAPSGVEMQEMQEDSEYLRLDPDDLEMDEFDVVQPVENTRWRRVWYWTKILVVAFVAFAVIGAVFVFLGPFLLEKVVIPLLDWEARTFSRPVLAFVLIASLALFPLVLIPSGPSMWLAGIVFGYGVGFLIIMVGTFIGQSLPFFIGHQLVHDRIRNWLKRWPKQVSVLKFAEQGTWFHQFRAIALLRVSPFPYPFFNYAITVTTIGYGPYIMGSMTGMVPEAFITIYSGKLLRTLADVNHQKRTLTPVEIVYNTVGLSVAAVIGITVTVYGRRAMQEFELREAAEKMSLDDDESGQLDGCEESELKEDLKRLIAVNGETPVALSTEERLDRSGSRQESEYHRPFINPTGGSTRSSGEKEIEVEIPAAAA